MTPEEKTRRAKLMRRIAILGALLGLLCHLLPVEKRVLCTSVVKVLSLSCGV
jgi:hypothetical protein